MSLIVFVGTRQVASVGTTMEAAVVAKAPLEGASPEPVLVFDDQTGEVVDLDFRARPDGPPQPPPRGVGRPKLGVVAREVTLLPRHWDWLALQPGGASVALRKLVEEARRADEPADRVRLAREATYKFIRAMAGNEPGFEEALRALFAGRREGFEIHSAAWPKDVRSVALEMATAAW